MTPALAAVLSDAAAGWRNVCLHAIRWPSTPLSTALPTLGYLDLTSPLTDALQADLRHCATSVNTLYVPGLQLSTAADAGTRYPWRTVVVEGEIRIGDWLRQAQFMGGRVQWGFESTLELTLSADKVGSKHCAKQLLACQSFVNF